MSSQCAYKIDITWNALVMVLFPCQFRRTSNGKRHRYANDVSVIFVYLTNVFILIFIHNCANTK